MNEPFVCRLPIGERPTQEQARAMRHAYKAQRASTRDVVRTTRSRERLAVDGRRLPYREVQS